MNHLIIAAALLYLLFLCYWVVQWRIRLARVRKTMPAIALIFGPYWTPRRFIPKKYQTFYPDWHFESRGKYNFGTGIIPLISLFGGDAIYVSDADGIVELSTDTVRFPKDPQTYRKSFVEAFSDFRDPWYFWKKCGDDRWRGLAITQENHFATIFRAKQSTRP
jgi:hypothetical protein